MYIRKFENFEINESVDQHEEELIKKFKKHFYKKIINISNMYGSDYMEEAEDNNYKDIFITFILYSTEDQFDIPPYKNGEKYVVFGMDSDENSTDRHFYIYDQEKDDFVVPEDELLDQMFEFDDHYYFMNSFSEISSISSKDVDFDMINKLIKKVNQ